MQKINFSLADGGALMNRLGERGLLGLIPHSLSGRVILAAAIAWVPLLVLTAREGLAWGTQVRIPFLYDLVQYARFLVALPCVISLGRYINPRIENTLNSFLLTGIVSGEDVIRFEQAISKAKALLNSVIPELLILVLVYLYVSLKLQRDRVLDISSWSMVSQATVEWLPRTASDRWFLWVSMPLLLFVTFLWAWRIAVWALLLFRISRLNLRVIGIHPDRVGGLSFVNVGIRRFSVLAFSISSILCASIGEEIIFRGTPLKSFEAELVASFLICLGVVLGPLLVFTPSLIRAKLKNWGQYGVLAGHYVQGFDDKWIHSNVPDRERLLGSPDIQSLADMGNSFSGITQMRVFLANRTTVGLFVAAYLLPAVPLLASVIPLKQVLSEIYKLLVK